MRLQILDLAKGDLLDGFDFYERKEKGLGQYFLVSLYSDIESLKVFGGIHRKAHRGFHRALSKRFPFARSIIQSRPTRCGSVLWSIVVGSRHGFDGI
jgi:hypothetical protein